jgi:carbon-monoxide dehydrogenase medium subunit
MTMETIPRFVLHQPTELQDALQLLARHGSRARPLAGGTDLLLKMRARSIRVDHVVSLNRIDSFRSIGWDDRDGLCIGAGARISSVAGHEKVQQRYPALAHACSVMATNQIRNMATVVGNIVNASPCADTACPLLCCDAMVSIAATGSERSLPIGAFFKGPSIVDLKEGELVTALRLPPPPTGLSSRYLRLSARSKVDMAGVSCGVSLKLDGDGRVQFVRLALGSVAPTPLRVESVESWLEGKVLDEAVVEQAVGEAAKAASPIGDVRASRDYRNVIVPVLLRRALIDCRAEQKQKGGAG